MNLFSQTQWILKNCVIFLDVDGTLVGDGGAKPDKATLKTFAELKKSNTLILCSNSPKKDRTKKLAKQLHVDWTKGIHKKPDKRVFDELKFPKNKQKIVIGNLFCIDGRFAKNIGAEFFPVKTLLGTHDIWTDKCFYFIDRYIFSLWI